MPEDAERKGLGTPATRAGILEKLVSTGVLERRKVKNQIILDRLKDAKGEERSTRYVCAMAVIMPDGREFCALGTVEGLIAEKPSGNGGFGYDPIFFVPEYGKTMAELTPDEKNAISHRGRALRAVRKLVDEA